jgi:2-aminoethylphosphonate-pyruvate transaminase
MTSLPRSADKPLFTPGPLTTSQTVKLAMVRDLGSRDGEFVAMVRQIRADLLSLAGVSQRDGYESILMQGSGTFGVEAVISSVIPPQGKLLVCINGAYGDRIAAMAKVHRIPVVTVRAPEDQPIDPADVDRAIAADAAITDVAIVHCETTSGIINPIEAIGQIVRRHGKTYFVDSMSAFGAVPFNFRAAEIDYLVSSANKCIEGVPGFSFAIVRRAALESTAGFARTLSLDLLAQWKGLEGNGLVRFTPPVQSILAFHQAMIELTAEGGVAGRAARYQANHDCLLEGMNALGFEEYLPRHLQGYIITSFRYPTHPNFQFEEFYTRLNDKGFVIYPGKVSNADCFRIGHVGRLFPSDTRALLHAVSDTLQEMGVELQPANVA